MLIYAWHRTALFLPSWRNGWIKHPSKGTGAYPRLSDDWILHLPKHILQAWRHSKDIQKFPPQGLPGSRWQHLPPPWSLLLATEGSFGRVRREILAFDDHEVMTEGQFFTVSQSPNLVPKCHSKPPEQPHPGGDWSTILLTQVHRPGHLQLSLVHTSPKTFGIWRTSEEREDWGWSSRNS
jgi:hypothetical protein